MGRSGDGRLDLGTEAGDLVAGCWWCAVIVMKEAKV